MEAFDRKYTHFLSFSTPYVLFLNTFLLYFLQFYLIISLLSFLPSFFSTSFSSSLFPFFLALSFHLSSFLPSFLSSFLLVSTSFFLLTISANVQTTQHSHNLYKSLITFFHQFFFYLLFLFLFYFSVFLFRFKKGAFQMAKAAGVKIVPVSIGNLHRSVRTFSLFDNMALVSFCLPHFVSSLLSQYFKFYQEHF